MSKDGFAYARPRKVTNVSQCYFYHVMDLPEIGTVGESWDLRKTIDAYLGFQKFDGARALDVGAASGYLTFEMERRGASVVSFDADLGARREIVPFTNPRFDLKGRQEATADRHQDLINGYWFAHRLLGSSAKAWYGSVYDLPEELGPFDVVLLGMILPHLRDPFAALESACRLSRDRVIVTQQCYRSRHPEMSLMPDPGTLKPDAAWWGMSEAVVERMLDILGFKVVSKIREKHACISESRKDTCTAFTARRR